MSEKPSFNEKEKMVTQSFLKIMEEIGWMGKFTIRIFLIMFIIMIYGAMNIVGVVFLAADVSHYCKISEQIKDNITEVRFFSTVEAILTTRFLNKK